MQSIQYNDSAVKDTDYVMAGDQVEGASKSYYFSIISKKSSHNKLFVKFTYVEMLRPDEIRSSLDAKERQALKSQSSSFKKNDGQQIIDCNLVNSNQMNGGHQSIEEMDKL